MIIAICAATSRRNTFLAFCAGIILIVAFVHRNDRPFHKTCANGFFLMSDSKVNALMITVCYNDSLSVIKARHFWINKLLSVEQQVIELNWLTHVGGERDWTFKLEISHKMPNTVECGWWIKCSQIALSIRPTSVQQCVEISALSLGNWTSFHFIHFFTASSVFAHSLWGKLHH